MEFQRAFESLIKALQLSLTENWGKEVYYSIKGLSGSLIDSYRNQLLKPQILGIFQEFSWLNHN